MRRRFKRLKLGSVLGYLAAGIAIGPYGLKLLTEPATLSVSRRVDLQDPAWRRRAEQRRWMRYWPGTLSI